MLFVSLLLVCGGSAGVVFAKSTPNVTYHIDDAENLFEKFIQDFSKWYKNETEKQMRFEIFKTNLQRINELNAGLKLPEYAITQFADLLPKEFNKYKGYGSETTALERCNSVNSQIPIGAPDSYDWREQNVVTSVKSQGRCGSCWAFSTTGIYLMKNKGLESEAEYPYAGLVQQCHSQNNLTRVTVKGCTEFTGINEDQLKEALYRYGPLAIGVCADTWQHYPGGVITNCPQCKVDHAVLLVGYGIENETPFWIIKNSWGTAVAEQGYFRIVRGQNACNILRGMIVTAIVA